MHRVPRLDRRNARIQRRSEQIEIAQQVEKLVPDELVLETQAVGGLDAPLSNNDRIVEAPAPGKPCGAKAFYLGCQSEGPRSGDARDKVVLRRVENGHLGSNGALRVLNNVGERKIALRKEGYLRLSRAVYYCHRKRRRKGLQADSGGFFLCCGR